MTSETITVSLLIEKQINLIYQCQISLESQKDDPAAKARASVGGVDATAEKLQALCNGLKILQECER